MSFGAPLFLAAGALAALFVTALHFLARQHPRAAPFPTASFIPERTARAPSRALRPSDLLLLALRVAAALMLGAAFARPVWAPPRNGTARVLLVDRSRAAAGAAELRDSTLALLRDGDALVVFDSAPHVVHGATRDSVRTLALSNAAGSLSAALIIAHSAVAAVAATADSVELILISPVALDEWDAATLPIRAQWPGRVRVVRVRAAPPDLMRGTIEIRGALDDPLRTAGLGTRHSALGVRVARGTSGVEDSLWAATTGGVLVRWPAHVDGPVLDTIGAVVMGDDVVVAPFTRYSPPSAERRVPRPAVVARWGDGTPAATEISSGGRGCIRDVTVPVPSAGDLVLRENFRRVVAGLFAPCGGGRGAPPVSESLLGQLRGVAGLAPARAWTQRERDTPPLTRWLLVAAALLLVAEPLVRRRVA